MTLLTKVSLAVLVLLVSIVCAPAVKADALTINTGGFSLTNLGNDLSGIDGVDALKGTASIDLRDVSGSADFVAALNPLEFTTDFTGDNSGGNHPFSFSQEVTVNGQTQIMNIVGSIDIDHLVDTIHIISADPLFFDFNTFSVAVNLIPLDLEGFGGVSLADLQAQISVTQNDIGPNDPAPEVPEPATLTLLGLGLAGAAAKVRQRRKRTVST
jgi:hypothetical protein